MQLNEIIAPTMKELFIQEIEKKIISGEWPKGTKLPTERDMQNQMKVSRTIINGGLKVLEEKGFVEIKPRKGVYVSDYTRNGNFQTLLSIMQFNGGKLNKKTFDSLMTYRLETDNQCAILAARNRKEQDITELEEYLYLLENEKDPYKVSDLKLKFEKTIYIATGNAIYPLICNTFLPVNKKFSERLFLTYGLGDATYKYKEFIQAIKNHDELTAKECANAIMMRRIQQLQNIYYK